MTLIATDGKTIAADGLSTDASHINSRTTKKLVRRGRRIYGVTGLAALVEPLIDWIQKGADPKKQPKANDDDDNNFSVLVLGENGVWLYSNTTVYGHRVDLPFAIGYGAGSAEILMGLGKSPREAVELVAERNVWVGGMVQVEKVPDKVAQPCVGSPKFMQCEQSDIVCDGWVNALREADIHNNATYSARRIFDERYVPHYDFDPVTKPARRVVRPSIFDERIFTNLINKAVQGQALDPDEGALLKMWTLGQRRKKEGNSPRTGDRPEEKTPARNVSGRLRVIAAKASWLPNSRFLNDAADFIERQQMGLSPEENLSRFQKALEVDRAGSVSNFAEVTRRRDEDIAIGALMQHLLERRHDIAVHEREAAMKERPVERLVPRMNGTDAVSEDGAVGE
jgi:hypothetical protein